MSNPLLRITCSLSEKKSLPWKMLRALAVSFPGRLQAILRIVIMNYREYSLISHNIKITMSTLSFIKYKTLRRLRNYVDLAIMP